MSPACSIQFNSINQSINQSIHQSINQSINHLFAQVTKENKQATKVAAQQQKCPQSFAEFTRFAGL